MNIETQTNQIRRQILPSQSGTSDKTQAPAPDLVVDRFAPSNRYPDKQQLIYFDVKVRNQGDAAAGGFTVEVGGTTMVPDLERVQGLAPGESIKLLFGPANVGDANIGRYDVHVDSKNEVAESNESDNRLQTTVNVRHPFPRPPRRP